MSRSPVTYVKEFVPDPDHWFESLWSELAWERREDAPRREYWTNLYSRPYTYGRGRGERTYQPNTNHILIERGRAMIQERFDALLEGCFLNGYENARDWLGWHEDDDPGIDHRKPIAVITVGQGRNIQFRELLEPASDTKKAVYREPETLMLESGSLLLMHAGMQFTHQHRIPKASFEAKPRISLTYRGLMA